MSDEEETFDDGDVSGGEEYADLVCPLPNMAMLNQIIGAQLM